MVLFWLSYFILIFRAAGLRPFGVAALMMPTNGLRKYTTDWARSQDLTSAPYPDPFLEPPTLSEPFNFIFGHPLDLLTDLCYTLLIGGSVCSGTIERLVI